MVEEVKKITHKNEFYIKVISLLKESTNLSEIQNKLSISKQNLNYYLRKLSERGIIYKKANGWWEVKDLVKNMTKYENLLPKDYIRGHAFVWKVSFPQEIKGWNKRKEILEKNGINFNLVGALKDIPRIKVLGRKVWLCNNHIRIFETKEKSFYGENAIESRKQATLELLSILNAIETKLGLNLKPYEWDVAKEHYALIKNDLAIEQNKKGVILRISDDSGEWLIVDDSLEKGGELENIGKKALTTNISMQKWWNDKKENKFKVTDTFLLNCFNEQNKQISGVTQNQLIFAENMKSHISAIKELAKGVKELTKKVGEFGK